jgi:hypothetical protein
MLLPFLAATSNRRAAARNFNATAGAKFQNQSSRAAALVT